MFARHNLYKHEKMTTIAAEIIKCFYVKEKEVWKLRVRWWNVRHGREPACFAPFGEWDQKLEIPKSKVREWKWIDFDHRNEKPKLRELTFEQGRIHETIIGE